MIRFSSHLQPSSGTAEPMALPAMARSIFIAAVGWPDRAGVKLGVVQQWEFWPPDFWQFLILLWWKYVKMMMNDEALNVELPHLHTKPYWMFDLNIWGKFSFRKVVGRKKKLKTSQAADLLDIPLGGEGKNDRSPKWDGYLAAVQVLFGWPNDTTCTATLWTSLLNSPDFHIYSPSHTPSCHLNPRGPSKVVCASCSKLGHHKGFLARSLSGGLTQVMKIPPVIIHLKNHYDDEYYDGFLKWEYPQLSSILNHYNRIFHYNSSIINQFLGFPRFPGLPWRPSPPKHPHPAHSAARPSCFIQEIEEIQWIYGVW